MFPKSGKFKYSFENGKPWQSENLYAPFNFAVLKNAVDLEGELKQVKIKTTVYFDYLTSINKSDSIIDYKLDSFFEQTDINLSQDSIVNSVKSIAVNI